MATPWNLGGLRWSTLGKRVLGELSEDRILGRSAQLAFYFVLSLFPMLLLMMALLARFAGAQAKLRGALLEALEAVAPEAASGLVSGFLHEISQGLGRGGVSFALVFAVWSASSGMLAIMRALDHAYEIEQPRPWWKARLIAIGLAIALMMLVIAALSIIVYGEQIGLALSAALGERGAFATFWNVLKWPLAVAFVLLVFNLLYLYAPNLRQREWHWLMPGTVVAVALWLIAGLGFKLYLSHFGSYNAIYGSLGTAIVLLMWFYLTGIAILVGAQVNSEIQLAAGEAGGRA